MVIPINLCIVEVNILKGSILRGLRWYDIHYYNTVDNFGPVNKKVKIDNNILY
jgi:hypothetical protein